MNDLARVYVKGGDGGNGKVNFRHEKFAAKGGPDGGDGGRGGDVVFVADENIDNLIEFNYQKKFEAKNGEHGMGKKMHGKDMPSITVRVPVGTVIWEIPETFANTNLRERSTFNNLLKARILLIDMDTHNKEYIVAYGGKGGRGNDHFKSSTNQTPMQAEEGKPGEAKWLLLEHKVVADIGIIGLPNVGKSSLLKALTRANPKIAGYPFTTLEPNLGVASVGDKKIVLVDVPGVVEEAWEGKGIGPWFMRHLERTKILVQVLAPDPARGEDFVEQMANDYLIVRKELEKYGQGLPEKNEVVVVNKMELIEEKDREDIAKAIKTKIGKEVVYVSAGMGEVGELVAKLG